MSIVNSNTTEPVNYSYIGYQFNDTSDAIIQINETGYFSLINATVVSLPVGVFIVTGSCLFNSDNQGQGIYSASFYLRDNSDVIISSVNTISTNNVYIIYLYTANVIGTIYSSGTKDINSYVSGYAPYVSGDDAPVNEETNYINCTITITYTKIA
jgi:hypothetical protein